MAISLGILRRGDARPPRVLAYGVASIGKSSWTASGPLPVLLAADDTPDLTDASVPDQREPKEAH